MKKLSFFLVMLITAASTIFANGNTGNTPCAKDQYPDLHTGAYQPERQQPNGDVVSHITQTLPFSKVKYTGKGAQYEITHPDPNNECTEIKSVVNDTDEDLRTSTEICEKYPAALKRCDVSISLDFVNGKTNGVWRVHAIGRPIEPEKL